VRQGLKSFREEISEDWKKIGKIFRKKRLEATIYSICQSMKSIEILFSQLADPFMLIRNYAKDTEGLFA